MTNRFVILHMSLINGIGPVTIHTIVSSTAFPEGLSVLYNLSASEIALHYKISLPVAEKLTIGLADKQLLQREIALIEKHGIQWATIIDPTYPFLLRSIPAPPAVLYWKGSMLYQEAALAFVGSRQANHYGQHIINTFIPCLINAGFTIVSGGAIGADMMAHQAAVAGKGRTIVVLGSGLLRPYPSTNVALFNEVSLNGGAVCSIFPLTASALPGNFPARNRVIAGLALGIVVVQAAQKSGALITAHYALEQGREVMAVPGYFDDPLSAGCHDIIQQGALLVTSPEQIVKLFPQYAKELKHLSEENCGVPLKSSMSSTLNNDLNENEQRVCTACMTPMLFDELLQVLVLSPDQLREALFNLHLSGMVKQDGAGRWLFIR